jgi:hypothetical protein
MGEDKGERARLEKAKKLVEVLRELRAKETAVVQELETILAGGAGIGQRLAALRKAFAAAWGTRYSGGSYAWVFGKDDKLAKTLLERFDDGELQARVDRFIRDGDPWVCRQAHAFGVFVSGINRYAVTRPPAELEALEAGESVSSLESDVDATRRKIAERRG